MRIEKADFQRLVSVNWDHNSFPNTFLEENMVAALDSSQSPSFIGQKPAKIFAGDLFQTANSRSWEFLSAVRPEGSVSR